MNDPADQPEDELRLTFLEHLEELRTRLIRGLLALLAGSIVGYMLGMRILKGIAPPNSTLIALNPAEHFFPFIELAIVIGLLLSLPYQVYQIWMFVAPGLYRRERQYVLPVVIAASFFFYIGVAFAHFVIIPLALKFLAAFSAGLIEPSYAAGAYLRFYLQMALVFGAAFNTPVVITLLSLLGVVEVSTLSKWRPYIVVAIFTVAAILTPPDWITQTLLGGPLWLLFEAGIVVARVIEWKRGGMHHAETQAGAGTQSPDHSTPA